jgi:hypothetical protein
MGGVDLNRLGALSLGFQGARMNAGKTLFTQLMDFLPWSTFARLVERFAGWPFWS